ncbi:FAD-dependent oxidoreductase [Legionella sp. W05-934-2]|uniref:FAD-dependent oxidoreductase n=1 Tax=Legionella sp. W05-934-2 TaxID=1198649 RepID=UPI003462E8AF
MKEVHIPLFQFIEQVRQPPEVQSVEQRIRHFASIYSHYTEDQASAQSTRCIDCGNPYCQWKCPVHNRIPQWLRLVAEGRIMEAADLAHQTNSLPEMCGQLCPQSQLCEGACTLNDGLGAVTIGAIENYLADTALRQGWRPDLSGVKAQPYRVAIVGAGPAGLACADRLARLGIATDVFDKHPQIGGLLTFGIPQFKLEKRVVIRRRHILEGMGIQFHTGVEIGRDRSIDSLLGEYDAVFLGLGADAGIQANVAGENMEGVYSALPFLITNIKPLLGYEAETMDFKGKVVLVLGAGDTAMDCSRTSIRLGAKEVHCLYRRREDDLHISDKDYKHAREEGVQFHWLRQVTAFHGKERLSSVEVTHTRFNDEGKLQLTNKKEHLSADVVIIAYGFNAAKFDWFDPLGLQTKPNGLIQLDESPYPLQTHHPKIFAGGDLVLGANLVVNAIAQGQMAAQSIARYLTEEKS